MKDVYWLAILIDFEKLAVKLINSLGKMECVDKFRYLGDLIGAGVGAE